MKTSFDRLGLTIAVAAVLFLAGGCRSAHDGCCDSSGKCPLPVTSVPTKESQAAMTPKQALEELRRGNALFAAGKSRSRNYAAEIKATANGQYPFAVVLSCIDSRQPIEIVFDQGIGDIFSTRIAGNVLDEDALGSLEFSCKVAGAKLIAVIGHSNCGAVKGAIDNVQLGNLTSLLAKIKPVIDAVPDDGQPRTVKNHDFVNKVVAANVHQVMKEIRERSPVLREMLDKGDIGLAGGVYDIATGKVEFFAE